MNSIIIKIPLLFATFASILAANSQDEPVVKFTSAKCTSTNTSLNYKCFVKAYSRKNSTLNASFNITRELTEASMNFEVRYRAMNQFRTIINMTLDFCGAMKSRNNLMVNWLLNVWSDNFRNNLHECPYKIVSQLEPYLWIKKLPLHFKGPLNFKDLYLHLNRLVSRFAGGHYMIVMHFFNDSDENIVTLTFTHEFITTDRVEF
jgi:hypothetical protein